MKKLIHVLIVSVFFLTTQVYSTTLIVGPAETYTTIQSAIIAASSEDTILVKNGTYSENIFIDKAVTLQSEKATESTFITHAMGIMSDNVTVNGFTFPPNTASVGIVTGLNNLPNSNLKILDNHIIERDKGIQINHDDCSEITISENSIESCRRDGIELKGSGSLIIDKNMISSNGTGVSVSEGKSGTELTNNTISNNAGSGVSAQAGVTLRGNIIKENGDGGVWLSPLAGGTDIGQDNEAEAGNNIIQNNTNWNVFNNMEESIPAYRNYWGLTTANEIDATLYDDDENGTKGPVNFEPFLTSDPTSVKAPIVQNMPERNDLITAYPSPFNPQIQIKFTLRRDTDIRLDVVDILGRHIRNLLIGYFSEGSYSINWNGKDTRGLRPASGIYLLVLETEETTHALRITLIR